MTGRSPRPCLLLQMRRPAPPARRVWLVQQLPPLGHLCDPPSWLSNLGNHSWSTSRPTVLQGGPSWPLTPLSASDLVSAWWGAGCLFRA